MTTMMTIQRRRQYDDNDTTTTPIGRLRYSNNDNIMTTTIQQRRYNNDNDTTMNDCVSPLGNKMVGKPAIHIHFVGDGDKCGAGSGACKEGNGYANVGISEETSGEDDDQ